MFNKAERKRSKLRLCLTGPSGAGKTYSALQIAKGLISNPNEKIAMIDTEKGSGELYSHLVDFDIAQLQPPFLIQKYIDMITTASQAGYSVLIIDSLSHGWIGEGGLLDQHQKVTQSRRDRNSFAAWGEITPMQNRLIDTILSTPMHVIVTLRTKTAWEVVENDRGKKQPVKVGLAPQQREGLDYEFSVVFDLSPDKHIAIASKDRTGLFDGEQFTPSPATGKKFLQWLDSGIDQSEASTQLLTNLQSQISSSDTMASLKAVWQQNEQMIENQLTSEHIEDLKTCWLSKKESFEKPINNSSVSTMTSHPTH
jgi:nucleoside-triphosphatase THEP1